jgi:iron(III) transport system substrate-binding protein
MIMMRRNRSLAAATVVAAMAACVVPATAQGQVTVYCSALAEWCEVMRKAFEAKTGTKVLMTVKSTGETMAQVRAEASNPKGDIWWAGTSDPHLEAARLDFTQPYASPRLAELQPWAQEVAKLSDNKTVGVYAGTIGITWHSEQLAKRNLPEPKCWDDLLKPIYKDEIQMSHPGTSGTSYIILATLVQLMGEEKAFAYLKALHANMNQYPRSGAAPMQNVVRGETLIAVTWSFAAVAEAASGAPVKAVTPCEGTGYEIGSMSILKGARNLDAAKQWYDFALTAEAQATGAAAKSYQIPSNKSAPLPKGTPRLEDTKLISYDLVKYSDPAVRKALLERWEKDIGGKAR